MAPDLFFFVSRMVAREWLRFFFLGAVNCCRQNVVLSVGTKMNVYLCRFKPTMIQLLSLSENKWVIVTWCLSTITFPIIRYKLPQYMILLLYLLVKFLHQDEWPGENKWHGKQTCSFFFFNKQMLYKNKALKSELVSWSWGPVWLLSVWLFLQAFKEDLLFLQVVVLLCA